MVEEPKLGTITVSEETRRRLENLFGGGKGHDEVLSYLLEEKELLDAIIPKMVESDRIYSASQEISLTLSFAILKNTDIAQVISGLSEKVGLAGDVSMREYYNRLMVSVRQGYGLDSNNVDLQHFIRRAGELWNKHAEQLNLSLDVLKKITSSNISVTDKAVFFDDEVEPQIYSIVDKATKYVTIVTPYIELWGHLQSKIEKALARGVVISFIIRKENNSNNAKRREALDWLKRHNVKIYEKDLLHAKIYMNDSTVLISSMNIYNFSANNSLEFAMIVKDKSGAVQFRNYVSELI